MTPDRKALAAKLRAWVRDEPTDDDFGMLDRDFEAIADILDPPPREGEIVVRVALARDRFGHWEACAITPGDPDDDAWDALANMGDGHMTAPRIHVLRFPPPVVPEVVGEVE